MTIAQFKDTGKAYQVKIIFQKGSTFTIALGYRGISLTAKGICDNPNWAQSVDKATSEQYSKEILNRLVFLIGQKISYLAIIQVIQSLAPQCNNMKDLMDQINNSNFA